MGFGAMRLTGQGVWGEPDDAAQALAVLRRAVELGITLIDTADTYGPDVSERLIAAALHPYPAELVIATKGGMTRAGPGEWDTDGRPRHLRQALEASLRRLRLERVDLYQLHAPDPDVPFAESVGALADLQREGKIRYIGLSNVDVDQLAKARREAQVVSVQNRYNVADRESEPVLEACAASGTAFLPWRPLAGGEFPADGLLQLVARAHDASAEQVALAWLLQRSPVILPIPGTSSVAHLEANVAAAALELAREELAALDELAGDGAD